MRSTKLGRRPKLQALAIVLIVTMSASGCGSKPQFEPLAPPRLTVPPLDSEAAEPCPDPGIDRNPRIAVIETRVALAVCEGRRDLAVRSYERLRAAATPAEDSGR